METNILVQHFVKEANGEDIRCLVVGDKVIASMMRKGQDGDFRSNLHRGGTAMSIKITAQERATALKSAKAVGLNVCGVDLLRSNTGPVVNQGDGLFHIAQLPQAAENIDGIEAYDDEWGDDQFIDDAAPN